MQCDCGKLVLIEDPNGIAGTAHASDDKSVIGWEEFWLGDLSPYEHVWEYDDSQCTLAPTVSKPDGG